MAEVAAHAQLDLLHVHYALPHAISAHLAREMIRGNGVRLRVLTTLHGTDITIVGQDRSYLPITRYGIETSDAVTAVSRYLQRRHGAGARRDAAHRGHTELRGPARVPARRRLRVSRAPSRGPGESLLMHVSNFRPVKRIPDVLAVFDRVRREVPARLILIGDGPERSMAERLAREGGFDEQTTFLGNVAAVETILPIARAVPAAVRRGVLRPRRARGDGVRRARDRHERRRPARGRRARAHGLPSPRRRRGRHGRVRPSRCCADPGLWQDFSLEARRRAVEEYPREGIVSRYRSLYEETLTRSR